MLFRRLFSFFFLFFFQFFADGFVSRRAKCSIECYTKCANSGTPLAVYCNCPPLNVESDQCNSVTEQLLTDKTVERLIESDSGYKDARTIWLKVAAVPEAFIYIFEFSIQQSFDRPIWTFAGASSSPQITFAVPDACRDYQFRTISVLRSTDMTHQLTVFRPKSIPPQFPPFVVPKQSLQFDLPKQSMDQQTVKVSVSWQNPSGYDDGDVYGYSPPTAYPIRCQTVEDQLAPPRLELVQGGAKMHLILPADVLRGQCNVYMEVRMLPKCVRIDPFDIQISVELNCQKFPYLPFCQKENGPKCADVVDLWGKEEGRVAVVWQRPPGQTTPLFYVVNWGATATDQLPPLAHSQNASAPPITSHRIAHGVQLKVPANRTNLELSGVLPATPYGIQICAFFSAVPLPLEANPFRTEPIIPFICALCDLKTTGRSTNLSKECIDCSKIEQSKVANQQMGDEKPFQRGTSSSPPVPSSSHQNVPSSSSHHLMRFISSDTAFLDVIGTDALENGTNSEENGQPKRQNHSKTHKTEMPLELTKVEKKERKKKEKGEDEEEEEELITMEMEKEEKKGKKEEEERERKRKGGEKGEEEKWKEMEKEEKEGKKEEEERERKRKGGEKGEEEKWKEMEKEEKEGKKEEEERERKRKEGEKREEEKKIVTVGGEKQKKLQMNTVTPIPSKLANPTGENANDGQDKKNDRNELKTMPNERNNNQQRMIRLGQGEKSDPSKSERKSATLARFDMRNWLFAVPALFLCGLFVGLAILLLLAVCRRRNARIRQNAFLNANSLSNHRKCVPNMRFPNGRSVLAARTMANGRFAAGNGTVGFAGCSNFAGMMAPVNCSSPASSPPFSATSSISTVESRLDPSGSVSLLRGRETERTLPSVTVDRGTPLPPSATANHFADNTARFFMRFPSGNGNGGNLFFENQKNNVYF